MTRTFLCKGDKADEAVITEGLPGNTYSEGGAELELATVYMKTYCHTCKKEGFICPSGPRLPGATENGKMWALSGDINICNCDPPPVFEATRNYTMTMDGEGAAQSSTSQNVHDQHFLLLNSDGSPIEGLRYCLQSEAGEIIKGNTTAHGITEKLTTDGVRGVKLVLDLGKGV
ncbi:MULTISPECIES: hypothetical protein [Paraburkholderia]|uniref:hypothetical protein n=1 Tax=Paraburkholderia TaxID=1822464 RepID=UPI00225C0109|nr:MULTISPECIES: hypothetical protein [Paraburkholderia]MCX4163678.1 hypothetical protein [Paraburkholderia megapolitana]MDN7159173.1 hypothetical protein [Paraburkholderia sp. CHISQ3]MDQ6496220.1 hypothetical protein [Paraburkholderia megapolitana]